MSNRRNTWSLCCTTIPCIWDLRAGMDSNFASTRTSASAMGWRSRGARLAAPLQKSCDDPSGTTMIASCPGSISVPSPRGSWKRQVPSGGFGAASGLKSSEAGPACAGDVPAPSTVAKASEKTTIAMTVMVHRPRRARILGMVDLRVNGF
jgi:hypothetical protein